MFEIPNFIVQCTLVTFIDYWVQVEFIPCSLTIHKNTIWSFISDNRRTYNWVMFLLIKLTGQITTCTVYVLITRFIYGLRTVKTRCMHGMRKYGAYRLYKVTPGFFASVSNRVYVWNMPQIRDRSLPPTNSHDNDIICYRFANDTIFVSMVHD